MASIQDSSCKKGYKLVPEPTSEENASSLSTLYVCIVTEVLSATAAEASIILL